MFTQQQAAQVKQLVIKHYKRFVTQEELAKIYEADYAEYLQVKEEAGIESYAEYFGEIFDDMYGEVAFLDVVEFALAS